MLITYKTTRHTRDVAASIGRRLVASGIADSAEPVEEPDMVVAPRPTESALAAAADSFDPPVEDISPRTGRARRRYRRRDVRAED